jgi:hypothetical protein
MLKTELKRAFYGQNKVKGLFCRKSKLPEAKLRETEG